MSKYEQANTNLFKKALNNWYWYLICLAVAIVGAWYSLAKESPVWRVSGSIIVEEDRSNNGQLPEEAIIQGLPFKNKGSLDRQIQMLKSRNLMEKVVDSLDLDILYYAEERFLNRELYKQTPIVIASVDDKAKAYGKILRVKQLDENRFNFIKGENDTLTYNFGVPFVFEGSTFTLDRKTDNPSLDNVILIQFAHKTGIAGWLASKLDFQKQAQSNVLTVTMTDHTPQKVIDIINKLVDVYNYAAQEEKNRIAEHSLKFIDERLSYLSSELFQVESSQASIKTSTEVPTDIGASAERYLDKLNTAEESVTQINNVRTTLLNLQNFLSNFGNRYQYIPSFGDLGGISLESFIKQYNKLIESRENLLITATPEHPGAKQAEENLTNLRRTILQGIDLALTDLDKKEQDLRAQAAPIQQKVSRLPFVDQRLNDIKRKVGVKDELVLYMLQKREETAIGLATTVERTRILDEPISGPGPIAPSKRQTYLLAFVLGLAVPTGAIFLLDKMNDKVSTRAEVKAISALPYLGEVAYAKSERSKLVAANSRSVIAEMFRLIRTNLDFLTAGKKEKVIIVTSNMSGDGKTFITGNLGAVLALTNKKTVLIELDLRKPKLTQFLLNKPQTTGITNYLVDEKSLDEIIQPIENYDNLFLISAGPTPPNPAELIMSERMKELIAELKKDFDYIVIDTPPTGLVADAYLLKELTTVSIFVVRAGKTKKDELEEISNMGKEGKLTSPAIVLNGIKTPKRYGYYY
jgi:tyrosine-protein kinase Etk/Wzc